MTQCNHSAYFVRVWLAATNAARKAVDRFADRSIAYERVPIHFRSVLRSTDIDR